MNPDRFNDEPTILDFPEEPEKRDCKQCGQLFWVEECEQEFCEEECSELYHGSGYDDSARES